MRRGIWFVGAVAIFAALGCSVPTAPDCVGFTSTSPEMICVTGSARYFGIEGGFWAVGGDDGKTYDPLGALPAAFRHEGLRVRLLARVRNDVLSFHMAGPIVEIIEIRQL